MRDPILTRVFNQRGAVKAVSVGLGISTAAVSQWPQVPKKRVQAVAALLGVHPRDLRPDLFESEVA